MKIITEAIQFTKDSLREHYDKKYAGASRITREIVDKERGEHVEKLNELVDFFIHGKHSTMLTNDERIYFFSSLGSALNLYLIHIDEEIIRFNVPELQIKRKSIEKMLLAQYYRELEIHSFDEFFPKQQETTPKLLFFSYNINDKKIVGEISAILESKYGYTVFRAHDTIPGGKIWRDNLKENLTKCEGLVAYVTENFLPSFYAHQECGWVMGRKRRIFPIFLIDKKPGLLEEWQGKPIEGSPDPHYIAEIINDAFKNLK